MLQILENEIENVIFSFITPNIMELHKGTLLLFSLWSENSWSYNGLFFPELACWPTVP